MTGVFQGLDIAASGLRAELQRSEVVAANLANIHGRTADGQPYRRKSVVFEEVLRDVRGSSFDGVSGSHQLAAGVRVSKVYEDRVSPFLEVYDPGHVHANSEGFVLMSNVDIFREMIDMTIIERSFQANLTAMRSYRSMLQSTINNFR